MKLIVGLGNPGEKYQNTKHNAGFIAVDALVANKELVWKMDSKFNALVCNYDDILLFKPQTFMNESGTSVSAVVRFYKIISSEVMIVHDDVDLASGVIKKQTGVSSAGHHGVEDIIVKLGTKDFWRIRIGVGRPEDSKFEVEDWVLKDLSSIEIEKIKTLVPTLLTFKFKLRSHQINAISY